MTYDKIKELIFVQCEGVEHSQFEEITKLLNSIPRLRESEAILNALYAAGVDNWQWYGEALDTVG